MKTKTTQPTTIASWAIVIWRALEARGVNPRPIFERSGVDPAHFHDEGARYPISDMRRLWHAAVETTGDPCFGLEAGQYLHPTTFHALGYAWFASHTLYEAFERFVRFTRMISTGLSMRLVRAGDEAEVVWGVTDPSIDVAPAAGDAAAAALLVMCRASCGETFRPKRMRLTRPNPPCLDRFEALVRAPVEFGSPDNLMVLDRAELERQLPTGNFELARASEEVVVRYLAHLDRHEVAMQVKARLVEMLPSGRVTAKAMADALHLSVRSLQRKLGEQQTSFAQLLEDTRRELARQYVGTSRLSVGEITYLLGFADPANFTRAFRRWTGQSPSEFRTNHRETAQAGTPALE
ncbi:MAG: hypothetical protein AMJ84_06690 [Acidithiobacillales bacterium SM23_46]|jgi:AraC-like DNA-binding protein|nr:MAG: hypothetical protein AMJ84_06690 [Acidithiobacillales bacterium SM23_46]KPL27990.1 MAG: hypothetical protein AMJ72_05680 [Acidithiobacillales bacterium SM1_46]